MADSVDLQNLLLSVSDSVVLVNAGGEVSFMNPSAEALTGRSSSEAAGCGLWEVCMITSGDVQLPDSDEMDAMLARDGHYDLPPGTVIRPYGEKRDVPVTGTVFLRSDTARSRGLLQGLVLRDMGSRWYIPPALERLQSVNTMHILAGAVTTNLADLLTSLLARLDSMVSSCSDRKSLLRLARESKRVIGRIDSLVSVLAGGGENEEDRGGVSPVSTVIDRCMGLFSAAFPEVGVDIAFPDRTGYAELSSAMLEQILLNLLTNAAEALEGSSRILLTACRMDSGNRIGTLPAGSYVMISVSDHGCGIPAPDLSRIWSPYYSTKKDRFGLGLSAVLSIVREAGGHVTAYSQLGRGSIFTVFIPVPAGMEVESADDLIPDVLIRGFADSDHQALVRTAEAIGCETTDESLSGPVLLVDYDHLTSERELYSEMKPLKIIAALDRSCRSPEDRGENISFIGLPLRLESVVSAIAASVWIRSWPEGEDHEG